ncbi:hypothetical protein BC833DRAFT_157740 [Globomyces pollinis-pini]|nr:hypothetical protein BC833DRAFT_157740 [Globomyces pollinis-pini]
MKSTNQQVKPNLTIQSQIPRAIGILLGFIVCLIVVISSHLYLIPSESEKQFNPTKTCTEPPLGCWDGYNKEYYKCIQYTTETTIRLGVKFPAGTRNCYKSLYLNVDANTLYIFGWLFFWCILTSRVIEMMVIALLNRKARYLTCLAIVSNIPTVWYGCFVMMHYLNDRYYPMFYSQIYFSVTEIFSMMVMALHVNSKNQKYPYLLLMVGGTALCHALQLGLDESLMNFDWRIILRNCLLMIGDVFTTFSTWNLIGKSIRRKGVYFILICICEIILFQLLFADFASFQLSL